MDKKIVEIEGMACEKCKLRVENTLKNIEGITNVEVSLDEKNAKIEVNKDVENNIIKEAIEEIGFEVKNIK